MGHFIKNWNFQHQIITLFNRENKIKKSGTLLMNWPPSIVLQFKMVKLGLESFSLWFWVMILLCSSNKNFIATVSNTCTCELSLLPEILKPFLRNM